MFDDTSPKASHLSKASIWMESIVIGILMNLRLRHARKAPPTSIQRMDDKL
jgi:hypothetical protein